VVCTTLFFVAELGAGRPKSCHSSSTGAVEVLWGGTTPLESFGGGKNGSNLCSQKIVEFTCHVLTWLRINYDTWTYERLSFTKAFKLVLWTQSCPKEMLVRSYCPSETCLTSSSGTQWSPLIGPMGPMLIYFNRDVENYTLGRRCWWVFWSK
jgi:hypothetical protein